MSVTLLAGACADSENESAELGLEQGYVGGASIFSDQEFQTTAEALRGEAEEDIQSCMKAEGFDYQPVRYSLESSDPIAFDQISGVTDEEFAERWGFGIMLPEESDVDGTADTADLVVEPEQPVFLDEAEQFAYEDALLGTSEDNPGCQFKAYEKLRSYGVEYGNRFEEIRALRSQFSISPPVEAYYSEWSDCMEDEGHSYISPLEALTDYQELLPSGRVDFDDQRLVAISTVRCGGSVHNMLPEDLSDDWAEFVARFER